MCVVELKVSSGTKISKCYNITLSLWIMFGRLQLRTAYLEASILGTSPGTRTRCTLGQISYFSNNLWPVNFSVFCIHLL